jgi:hypothetical protein
MGEQSVDSFIDRSIAPESDDHVELFVTGAAAQFAGMTRAGRSDDLEIH